MATPTTNLFRLSNPSAAELLFEYDQLVSEKEKEGYDKKSAEDFATKYQKEKYYNK